MQIWMRTLIVALLLTLTTLSTLALTAAATVLLLCCCSAVRMCETKAFMPDKWPADEGARATEAERRSSHD